MVCGSFVGPISYDLWLGTYSLDLDPIWTTTWTASTPADRDDFCEDLAVDGFGNIFVAGRVDDGVDGDLWVARFDSSGNFEKEVLFDELGGEETALSLFIASNGAVYVAGEGDHGGSHALLHAYSNMLFDLWNSPPLALSASGVTQHPSGDLLVTGTWLNLSLDVWVGRVVP